ncbi:MAG TPA: pyridoxal phosphate-dependent aminotransferase [Bacteroidia bacterium]|jgi:aspartate aminotransferase|nr:pyridoxal phosphate-dependent aminotransferase [Bacteroidia bacterium]
MGILSSRVARLSESQTIAMARRSRELKAQGIDIVNLSLGEPDFATPDAVKEAAKKAIDDDFSHYTHVSGYLELRQAISKKFKRDNNLDYSAEQIVVSTGAKQSIANAVLSIIDPGDEIIVPSPYWVSYLDIIRLAEGKSIIVEAGLDTNFKVTAAQVKKAITPKTKLFIFSSPCNPTGSVYTRKELEEIAAVLAEHPNIYIISDEIYEHINFVGKNESIGTIPSVKDRVITVNGVSKAFAMTGWRVGYLGAPLEIAKACDKIQGQITSATCSIAQKATETAVLLDPSITDSMCAIFKTRRDLVLKLMKEIPGFKTNVPDGAFYVFPEVSYYFGKSHNGTTIKNATDLCFYLLDDARVSLVPGAAFGNDNYIRFSYAAAEDQLVKALQRLKESLARLA